MYAAVLLAGFLTACGGSSGETPDRRDKERVSTAAVTIAAECISAGSGADTATIEDQVTTLIAESDEAGTQRFTLSDSFSDVTMNDILLDRAKFMDDHRCAPRQADRLRDAAG